MIIDCNGSARNNSVSPPLDLSEEDDLGFDPFHETQKALAEMLETESKQQQQHGHHHQMKHMSRVDGHLDHAVRGSPSPAFVQQPPSAAVARTKAPPPGFNLGGNMPPSKHKY